MSRFTCQQVRDLVKARGHYLTAGCSAESEVVRGLTESVDGYILRVGFAEYISQMLDQVAKVPVSWCMLGWPDGRVFDGAEAEKPRQPVQHYIRKHCCRHKVYHDLPYVVEARLGVGQVVVRFL